MTKNFYCIIRDKKLETPFYLTGGTALSRHYFNHRYSDDIVLFVNSNSNYPLFRDLIINSFGWNVNFNSIEETIKLTDDYIMFFVE